MARKKVKLAWITNDSARRATFKKRKKGLMKKVSELSTLCGVGACAVVYGHQEAIPEVWPDAEGAARVLSVFRSMPEMEQSKKKMDQEGFLRQRIMKLGEQVKKQERENRELASRVLMNETLAGRMSVDCLGAEDVAGLGWMVEMKLKAVQERICNLRATMVIEGSKTSNVVEEKRVETTMGGGGAAVGRPEWFLDTVNQTMNDHLYWGVGEDVVQPLVDNSNLWLAPYDDLFTGN